MALGIKIRSVKTRNSYTIEELYETIRNECFTAGAPSLISYGPASVIAFPPLDSQNQVWILKAGFGKESQKFSVQKGEGADMGNIAVNSVADQLTGGLFGFKSMVGKNVEKCEQLVELTAKELDALGL